MTLNSFTDCTQRYETTLNDCECGDHLYRNRVCKHMEALRRAYARAKAATFEELRRQYDIRSETVKAQKREAFVQRFGIYA